LVGIGAVEQMLLEERGNRGFHSFVENVVEYDDVVVIREKRCEIGSIVPRVLLWSYVFSDGDHSAHGAQLELKLF
jgi:hypothetical protein